MSIFAISDLHLSFSRPDKTMELFGKKWENYQEKIKKSWIKNIKKEDLVLIPGDISWASTLLQAEKDIKWIDSLPGKKLFLKGNHDFWWKSKSKMKKFFPPSISFIQNDIFTFNKIAIGGSRLWDTDEYNFDKYIKKLKNPYAKNTSFDNEKIFEKELERLKLSLNLMKHCKMKIVMTHFPPIGGELKDSKVSKILESYQVNICVFGHLHNIEKKLFGIKNNIKYILTSSDYLNFSPIRIF